MHPARRHRERFADGPARAEPGAERAEPRGVAREPEAEAKARIGQRVGRGAVEGEHAIDAEAVAAQVEASTPREGVHVEAEGRECGPDHVARIRAHGERVERSLGRVFCANGHVAARHGVRVSRDMQSSTIAALVTLVTLVALGCDAPRPAITGTVVDETFASAIVGDEYRILVRLPPGYDTDTARRYPLVVQLDATSFGPQFEVMAGVASDLAARGEIPEIIVVGVGYPYEAGFGERRGRWRDYQTRLSDGTPAGAEEFAAFLEEELLPALRVRYRTAPDAGTALSGHSLGGFFALVELYRGGEGDPPAFDRILAGDPSLGEDDFLLADLDAALAPDTRLPARVYLSAARYDGAVQRLYFDIVREALAARPEVILRAEVLETDHGGAIERSFQAGLLHAFGGRS